MSILSNDIKYVLDIDDTLYLEYDYIVSGFTFLDRWFEKNIKKKGFLKKSLYFFEKNIRFKIFDCVLKEFGIYDKKLVEVLVFLYRNHFPNIKLLDDALKFLKDNKKKNLAIITDGNLISQKQKIKALNLKEYVSEIIITDEFGKDFWKPSVYAYKKVQKDLPPKNCIYIGDNPIKDFVAPQKLFWRESIRIKRKKSLHYKLKTPDGCLEVGNFELLKIKLKN